MKDSSTSRVPEFLSRFESLSPTEYSLQPTASSEHSEHPVFQDIQGVVSNTHTHTHTWYSSSHHSHHRMKHSVSDKTLHTSALCTNNKKNSQHLGFSGTQSSLDIGYLNVAEQR